MNEKTTEFLPECLGTDDSAELLGSEVPRCGPGFLECVDIVDEA